LQAASVEFLGCSFWGRNFFQFWMTGSGAEAEFQYPGHSERIQRQGLPSARAFK
jgi:hypothetical protein